MSGIRLHRIGFWCLVASVLLLALMPSESGVSAFPFDKLNHMLAFFVLSGLARILWPGPRAVILLVLLTCFGGAVELLQFAMGWGREADWWDFAADVLATVVGLLCGRMLLSLRERRTPPGR